MVQHVAAQSLRHRVRSSLACASQQHSTVYTLTLEKRESLEQLRALEDGMRIDAMIIDHVPRGVDTPPDLDRARAVLKTSA